MAMDPIVPPNLVSAWPADPRRVPAESDRAKVRELAEQFESMLLAQMLREMRESMAPETEGQGLGGPVMADVFNAELSQSLTRAGGLGMANYLMQALERLAPPAVGQVPPPSDTAEPGAAVPVSSGFGWRQDPINGSARFHAGQDLRVAYGQEIRAAAAGRVRSVGEQGAYGLMVVIDHEGGVETRYAHLSASDVRVGEAIAPGQVIARSGASGRSTGPHLHFEVRHDGEPVDPLSVSGLTAVADLGQ